MGPDVSAGGQSTSKGAQSNAKSKKAKSTAAKEGAAAKDGADKKGADKKQVPADSPASQDGSHILTTIETTQEYLTKHKIAHNVSICSFLVKLYLLFIFIPLLTFKTNLIACSSCINYDKRRNV